VAVGLFLEWAQCRSTNSTHRHWLCGWVVGVWNKCTPVAVKTLKPGTMSAAEFLKEATTMKQLQHPRLVALYAVCSCDQPILIITELMPGGSLLRCLQADKRRTITWNKLIDFAAQASSAEMRVLTHGSW